MDVSKAPPFDPAAKGIATPSKLSSGTPSSGTITPPADRIDIKPLDLEAAMQILLAEVRAELQVAPAGATVASAVPAALPLGPQPPPLNLAAPAGALPLPQNLAPLPLPTSTLSSSAAALPPRLDVAPQLIEFFLRALPQNTGDQAAWASAAKRIELAFSSALDRGVDTVAGWRNVPLPVVDAARDMRAAVIGQLKDDPPSPLWLRPEWLGLAPQVRQFWRRRRQFRAAFSDPDAWYRRDHDERAAGDQHDDGV